GRSPAAPWRRRRAASWRPARGRCRCARPRPDGPADRACPTLSRCSPACCARNRSLGRLRQEEVVGPGHVAGPQIGAPEARRAVLGDEVLDPRAILRPAGGAEGERDVAEVEVDQPVALARLIVILPPRHGVADQLELALIEAKAGIGGSTLRLQ